MQRGRYDTGYKTKKEQEHHSDWLTNTLGSCFRFLIKFRNPTETFLIVCYGNAAWKLQQEHIPYLTMTRIAAATRQSATWLIHRVRYVLRTFDSIANCLILFALFFNFFTTGSWKQVWQLEAAIPLFVFLPVIIKWRVFSLELLTQVSDVREKDGKVRQLKDATAKNYAKEIRCITAHKLDTESPINEARHEAIPNSATSV